MLRVLIVDDQPTFRRHLRQLLTYADFEVVGEADDIPAAMKFLKSIDHQPDIAIVDVVLPEINGLEGTRRIKSLFPSLRVFLVSAYRDQAMVFQASAEKAGAEGFLSKDDLDLEVVKAWKIE